jgi:hypothetical protein
MEPINLDVLTRPFAPEQIRQREGRGGKMLDYLETHAVIARLNEAFNGAWSFEVLDFKTMEGEIVVHGKLTAVGVTKTQFGSSEVHRLKGQDGEKGAPVSIGDDLKAAASDALKKCATLFGVGLELYRRADRPAQRPPAARPQPAQSGPRVDQRTPQERPTSTSATPARSGSGPAARQPVNGSPMGVYRRQ